MANAIVANAHACNGVCRLVVFEGKRVEFFGRVGHASMLVDAAQRGVVHGYAQVVLQLLVDDDCFTEVLFGLHAVVKVLIHVAQSVVDIRLLLEPFWCMF